MFGDKAMSCTLNDYFELFAEFFKSKINILLELVHVNIEIKFL